MADLKKLVRPFDAFGWIPTIRGALSLDLIDNGKHLLGDVDKYAVEFLCHNGLSSSHYIAATSLLTVNDSKVGEDIYRTFRYMFVGAISDADFNTSLLTKYEIDDEETIRYIKKEGVLYGQLIILTESESDLSDDEVRLLMLMQEIVCKHDDFERSFSIRATSMEDLESKRMKMHGLWQDICTCVYDIKDDNQDSRPKYCFDVLLTRDGILLLKDTTSIMFYETYRKEGTPNDYTQNIAMHRIFKVAMTYIKYLFHVNYHHNIENDAFLPASNLHPARRNDNFDLRGVFKHQLNAFLNPITKMKRNGFADYTMDANGIMLYAKAFVNVFKENLLVDTDLANRAESFIDLQKQEVEHMTQGSKALVNSVLVQHNPLIIFTGVLAFVVAVVKLFTSFIAIDRVSIWDLTSPLMFKKVGIYCLLIAICFFIGYTIYYITHSKVLSRRFVRKEQKTIIPFGDSNTIKKRFSYSYQFYIWIHTQMLVVGIIGAALLKVLFWVVILTSVAMLLNLLFIHMY